MPQDTVLRGRAGGYVKRKMYKANVCLWVCMSRASDEQHLQYAQLLLPQLLFVSNLRVHRHMGSGTHCLPHVQYHLFW